MKTIPYGRQDISQDDIDSVIEALRSDFLTQGPIVKRFENAILTYCNAKYAIAVNSATSALHIACKALGVGTGDLVWTSPITFVASANCALFCGAEVDFVDIDSKTYNISTEKLEEKLYLAKKHSRLPKVLIPVHLAGQSCDMEKIYDLALDYGFKIIEDASHAIGGKYKGKPVGNCQYSDISVFSFHPVKIITTAEGGVATTNDPDLQQKMRLFASHFITRDQELMESESPGPWYYEQIGLGYNYRMNEMQAALGLSQMSKIDQFVNRRHAIADIYNVELKTLALTLPFQAGYAYSAYHLYIIRLNLAFLRKNHRQIFEELRYQKIGVNLHYIPIYKQPYYKKLGFNDRYLPEAEKYYSEAISLPIYSALEDDRLLHVIDVLRNVIH